MNHRILIGLFVFAAALPAIAAPRPAYTPEQEKLLVIRVAHADGYVRLADAAD